MEGKRFGSRRKGKRAENEVATLLQEWWRGVEPECVFKSTPMSGGWAHGDAAARRGFKTSGDLTTTAATFPFVIEVKRRESFAESTFIAGRPSPIWGWWLQAQRQAKEQSAVPMLWFRSSRQPWRVLLPVRWWLLLNLGHHIVTATSWGGRWPKARGERPICVYSQTVLEHPHLRERATTLTR